MKERKKERKLFSHLKTTCKSEATMTDHLERVLRAVEQGREEEWVGEDESEEEEEEELSEEVTSQLSVWGRPGLKSAECV